MKWHFMKGIRTTGLILEICPQSPGPTHEMSNRYDESAATRGRGTIRGFSNASLGLTTQDAHFPPLSCNQETVFSSHAFVSLFSLSSPRLRRRRCWLTFAALFMHSFSAVHPWALVLSRFVPSPFLGAKQASPRRDSMLSWGGARLDLNHNRVRLMRVGFPNEFVGSAWEGRQHSRQAASNMGGIHDAIKAAIE